MLSDVYPVELDSYLRAASHWRWRSEAGELIADAKFASYPKRIKLKSRSDKIPPQGYLEISMDDLVGCVFPFSYAGTELIAYYVLYQGNEVLTGYEKHLNLASHRLCTKMLQIIKDKARQN